jgi:hypothetical protein
MPQSEDGMRQWSIATLAISLFGLAAGTRAAEPAMPGVPDGDGSLEWIYSCPSSKGCTFTCPTGRAVAAAGGTVAATGAALAAAHVTKLTIHLRRLRIGSEQAVALFYEYSTREFPSGSGFSINTGLGTLSCQVNGMTLDYFGPEKPNVQN